MAKQALICLGRGCVIGGWFLANHATFQIAFIFGAHVALTCGIVVLIAMLVERRRFSLQTLLTATTLIAAALGLIVYAAGK